MSREYTATRVRGMAPWRPQPKSAELLAQVSAVLDEYAAHLPLTARQVFYRLVGAYDYPKDERAYERLGNLLNRARRASLVPFDAIRDDGVTVEDPGGFDDVAHFLRGVRHAATRYRRNRLNGQPVHVELWVEAGGMVPQLARVADPYGIAVFSSGGFDSTTAKHDAARRIVERDVPTVILHVGDFDPSGWAIFDSAFDDVATFAADLADYWGTPEVEFRRAVVTEEQVERYSLPVAPAKSTDRRGKWTGGTVQAEALRPDQLADEVRRAIDSLVDVEVLRGVMAQEEADRARVLEALAGLETR